MDTKRKNGSHQSQAHRTGGECPRARARVCSNAPRTQSAKGAIKKPGQYPGLPFSCKDHLLSLTVVYVFSDICKCSCNADNFPEAQLFTSASFPLSASF